ncbi:MAG: LytTR family DNA-binding domain-containing protein [Bacteroidales bacterium]
MEKIKAVIIDDESKSRATLKNLLNLCCPEVLLAGEADSMTSGRILCEKIRPELVFLDVEMPDGTGFQMLEQINPIEFDVIFTTAYDQFAIRAFRYSAVDYLLKPIFPDDLKSAVKKVMVRKKAGIVNRGTEVLLQNRARPGDPPKIVLTTIEKMHVVKVTDIIRCESDNYYTRFYFADSSRLLISKTLKEFEEMLRPHGFIRPHKSHLIRVDQIAEFIRKEGGMLRLQDGTIIPVSRRKKEEVLRAISDLSES